MTAQPEDDFSHPEDNHPPDRMTFGLFSYAALPPDGPEAASADDLVDGDLVSDPRGAGPFTVTGDPVPAAVGVYLRLRSGGDGRVHRGAYLETARFTRHRHARHVDELWSGHDTPVGAPILVGDVGAAMRAARVGDIGWRFPDACTWCGTLTGHTHGTCD